MIASRSSLKIETFKMDCKNAASALIGSGCVGCCAVVPKPDIIPPGFAPNPPPNDEPKVFVFPNNDGADVVAPKLEPNPPNVPPVVAPKPPNADVVCGCCVAAPNPPNAPDVDVFVPPKENAFVLVAVFVEPNKEPPNAGADETVPNAGAAVPKAGAVDVAAPAPNAGAGVEPNAGAAETGAAAPKAGAAPVAPNEGADPVPPKVGAVPGPPKALV